jgi:hypothetical protein
MNGLIISKRKITKGMNNPAFRTHLIA